MTTCRAATDGLSQVLMEKARKVNTFVRVLLRLPMHDEVDCHDDEHNPFNLQPAKVPSIVRNVTVTTPSTGRATVTFTIPETDSGSPILRYVACTESLGLNGPKATAYQSDLDHGSDYRIVQVHCLLLQRCRNVRTIVHKRRNSRRITQMY